MGTLSMFNFVSLDGYFKGPGGDTSWAHEAPENEHAAAMLAQGGALVFGRITYEMMASFWPTPAAAQMAPKVAEGMNAAEKIVVSRTLQKADWHNTRILAGDLGGQMRELKRTSDKHLTILGSGSLVTQLAALGLIDRYEIQLHPIVLGDGTPIFKGLPARLRLELAEAKTLKNGTVLLTYRPG
jgi:dihydrofolate reductase